MSRTDGLLIVDKPEGLTSADVVRVVKRHLRCKTGHLGTLDPFATGVLPLCLGEATKIAQFLNAADKAYAGRIRLGRATDTGDRTGQVVADSPVTAVAAAGLAAVEARFHGDLTQVPPMYSALKRDGTRLYQLARQGIEVDREPRSIHIARLVLRLVEDTAIDIEVDCSKGTYIRVLAEDIAKALGTVGHLESLRRTRFGRFGLDRAVSLAQIEHSAAPILGLREALSDLPEIELDAVGSRRARQGVASLLASLPKQQAGSLAKLIGPEGNLVAIVSRCESGWQYARVFGAESNAAA